MPDRPPETLTCLPTAGADRTALGTEHPAERGAGLRWSTAPGAPGVGAGGHIAQATAGAGAACLRCADVP